MLRIYLNDYGLRLTVDAQLAGADITVVNFYFEGKIVAAIG
ncbi:MAG: hypothetical protein OJF59_001807 [Cytophagales bacterium]|nr:MAG: hypothetical protein OJF59_001807 [Cytophagales bacterium]